MNDLSFIIVKTIFNHSDARDYDDANMIGVYNKMNKTDKEAVDRIFVYLTGHRFKDIIDLYNNFA